MALSVADGFYFNFNLIEFKIMYERHFGYVYICLRKFQKETPKQYCNMTISINEKYTYSNGSLYFMKHGCTHDVAKK